MKLLKHVFLLMILVFIASVSFAEYGAILITVMDSEGNGISNLRINIVSLAGENDKVADLSFNESLIWNTLDPGFYKIHIFAKDVGYKDEWYNNKTSYDMANIIEIQENETTSIDWTLDELGSGQISGQVVNKLNEGVFFAELSLYSSDQILIDEVTTNSSGKFSFTGLSDDSYRIYISHPGKCFEDTWYNNSS
ncbi:carboxypeptidase regulatory-like domain-containing protein, partial [Thermodesulfobacteriota bacterium]